MIEKVSDGRVIAQGQSEMLGVQIGAEQLGCFRRNEIVGIENINVNLIIDQSPTMRAAWMSQGEKWGDTFRELGLSSGEMRYLCDKADVKGLVMTDVWGNPVVGNESGNNQVTCIVSDCVGPKWRSGEIYEWLKGLKDHRVLVLQVLDEDEWDRTSLRDGISEIDEGIAGKGIERGEVYIMPFAGDKLIELIDLMATNMASYQQKRLSSFNGVDQVVKMSLKAELGINEVEERFRRCMEMLYLPQLDLARNMACFPIDSITMELVLEATSRTSDLERDLTHRDLAAVCNSGVLKRVEIGADDWSPNKTLKYDFMVGKGRTEDVYGKDGGVIRESREVSFEIRGWLLGQRSKDIFGLVLTEVEKIVGEMGGGSQYADLLEYIRLARVDSFDDTDLFNIERLPDYYQKALGYIRRRLGHYDMEL